MQLSQTARINRESSTLQMSLLLGDEHRLQRGWRDTLVTRKPGPWFSKAALLPSHPFDFSFLSTGNWTTTRLAALKMESFEHCVTWRFCELTSCDFLSCLYVRVFTSFHAAVLRERERKPVSVPPFCSCTLLKVFQPVKVNFLTSHRVGLLLIKPQ